MGSIVELVLGHFDELVDSEWTGIVLLMGLLLAVHVVDEHCIFDTTERLEERRDLVTLGDFLASCLEHGRDVAVAQHKLVDVAFEISHLGWHVLPLSPELLGCLLVVYDCFVHQKLEQQLSTLDALRGEQVGFRHGDLGGVGSERGEEALA